jgi:hypothetical protein
MYENQNVYSPVLDHQVERCEKYEDVTTNQNVIKQNVTTKQLANESPKKRRRGGTAANKAAAGKNPWIRFLKAYGEKNKMGYNDILLKMGRDPAFKMQIKNEYQRQK